MKKIIGIIVFIAALIWTWNLMNTQGSGISYETHIGIQKNFEVIIKNTIMDKKPSAQNIVITKNWTEPLSDNKVKLDFAYTYNDTDASGSVLQSISGEAILHRDPAAQEGEDRWIVQSIKTTGDSITFEEGLVIGPNSKDEVDALKAEDSNEVLPEEGLKQEGQESPNSNPATQ